MTLWDAHMHTSFSGDAHTPPEEMADTARGKQLPGITFTDHLDWDYRETPGMFDLDIERTCSASHSCRQNITQKIFTFILVWNSGCSLIWQRGTENYWIPAPSIL